MSMQRLFFALAPLALFFSGSCVLFVEEEGGPGPGAVTLVLGGASRLSADGEALLPVYVRSLDGLEHPHPGALTVTPTSDAFVFPRVEALAETSLELPGDGAVFFVRCRLGHDGEARVVAEREDGVADVVVVSCVEPREPRLSLSVADCSGHQAFEAEECTLRAQVVLEGPTETVPASGVPVTYFVVGVSDDEGPLSDDELLVSPDGEVADEVTVATDNDGYADVILSPPALYTPYAVELFASVRVGQTTLETAHTSVLFPFTDASTISLTAFPASVSSLAETQLDVGGVQLDGEPAAGAEVTLRLDNESVFRGALLRDGSGTIATTVTVTLDAAGQAIATFLAPAVEEFLEAQVFATRALTYSDRSLHDSTRIRVYPPLRPQLIVDVTPTAIDATGTATVVATLARVAPGVYEEPVAAELVTFTLDSTSVGLALLEGGSDAVERVTGEDGVASVVVTAAGPDLAGAAVVRASSVVDGELLEQLVVVDIVDAP